jgi:septal ring factor EnvC (AmiA/AmiB activator)
VIRPKPKPRPRPSPTKPRQKINRQDSFQYPVEGYARDATRKPSSFLGTLVGACWFLAIAPVPTLVLAQDQEELRALRGRIDTLRQDIASAEEVKGEASDQLRESEKAISDANRALRELGASQQAARAELRNISALRGRQEGDLAASQARLGQLLAARYQGGEQGFLRLALSGSDPNRTARELHYFGYVSRAQAEFVRTMRSGVARLLDLERQTRDKTRELAQLEGRQREERRMLLARQAERRKVLSRIQGQIRAQRREVKSLERNETRLARLVEEIGKVIGAPSSSRPGRRNDKLPEAGQGEGLFARLKGSLRLPVRGELTNRYGTSRAQGGPSWKGLFIRSETGQEVRAVAAGQVVFSEWMRGFGNLLILDHGQGYLTIYGNNEATLKQVGDRVKAGETVATVGASGGSPESGLYFEIRHQGRTFDPLSWVSLK